MCVCADMRACVCVCVCVCMCACVCVCVDLCACMRLHTCLLACMHVCVHVHMSAFHVACSHLHSKMPPDLLDDSNMMQLLSIAATRLEHMQVRWEGPVPFRCVFQRNITYTRTYAHTYCTNCMTVDVCLGSTDCDQNMHTKCYTHHSLTPHPPSCRATRV